jgi:hypothetical protein
MILLGIIKIFELKFNILYNSLFRDTFVLKVINKQYHLNFVDLIILLGKRT